MATATDPSTKVLRPGDRVVLAEAMPGFPEGSRGRVRTVVGMSWVRCWVEFEDGHWIGSVSAASLVPADDWEDYKRRRAEAAARAEEQAAAAAAAPPAAEATDAPAESAAKSKVPAHLLERSKAAKAKKAAG